MTTPKPKLPAAKCAELLCRPGTIFETETVVIEGRKQLVWKNIPKTFRELITTRLPQWGDKEWLSSPIAAPEPFHAREHVSFREAYERAVDLAAILRARGVEQGTRVAIGGTNCTGWIISFLAVQLLGGVGVLLNNGLHVDATIHCLNLTTPALVLLDDAMAAQVAPVVGKLKGVGPLFSWGSTSHLPAVVQQNVTELSTLKSNPAIVKEVKEGRFFTLNADSDAIIFFTSGTTSMPKGVLETQRQSLHIIASGTYPLARLVLRSGASPEDALALVSAPKPDACSLLSIPLFHVQGCLNWFIGSINDGSRLTFLRRWSVPDAIKLMVAEKVTKIGGVPAIVTSVLQSPLLPKDFFLQSSTFGGAAAPVRLASDVTKRWPGTIVATGWGMTETNSTATGFAGFEYVDKPTACGSPIPIVELRIVDEATRKPLPPRTPGLLLSRGSSMMKCYYNNPTATAKTIDSEGWLDTGDIAYVDEEGDLYIADRAKDIIIRGGENIPSAEVERAVSLDDRVAEACAVPVPDAVLGERVGLCVSLAPGATATPESIAEAVNPRLRYASRPAIVVVLDKPLPWNASQKILKSEVKKIVVEAWEQAGRLPMVDAKNARARL